ncbi:MAG: hypothetical protein LKE39_10750 [Sphaerochaeta sp.]|jgi:hypothetical protein|nr:hypothetical protein [Sphaerochaeta sp.]
MVEQTYIPQVYRNNPTNQAKIKWYVGMNKLANSKKAASNQRPFAHNTIDCLFRFKTVSWFALIRSGKYRNPPIAHPLLNGSEKHPFVFPVFPTLLVSVNKQTDQQQVENSSKQGFRHPVDGNHCRMPSPIDKISLSF